MPISHLASLNQPICPQLTVFCSSPYFQDFVAGVEAELKERLIELSVIASSRANADITKNLCDLAFHSLLESQKPI